MDNPYRNIPKIDKLLKHKRFKNLNKKVLTKAVKQEIEILRYKISKKETEEFDEDTLVDKIINRYKELLSFSLLPLVNATGITIHTNFGRALIGKEIFEEAKEIACNYSNLEYDIEQGKRGNRYKHTSKILGELFDVEDVLIVNNNASAVFLILNSFAKSKEVIVSRGELVEIGGSFRIPDVMSASGAILKEVGTTNKTYIKDYEDAVSDNTAIVMKVHKSNYKIVGFSEEVEYKDIRKLAKDRGILDYYDLGSGYIPKLPYGLSEYEPSIFEVLKSNPSLVSFSGDKLFGGVQAGIILGKREYISKLKENQILRTFRVDKLTLAILERTAIRYLKEEYEEIPTIKLLMQSLDQMRKRAEKLRRKLPFETQILESETYVGGGTMPEKKIPTIVLAIEGNPIDIEKLFRSKRVIGRVENSRFVLDMRTVRDEDISTIIEVFK